jgi:hypothetical protein
VTLLSFPPPNRIPKETTIPLALIVGIATPALAADYYVVRGPDKKRRSWSRGLRTKRWS